MRGIFGLAELLTMDSTPWTYLPMLICAWSVTRLCFTGYGPANLLHFSIALYP